MNKKLVSFVIISIIFIALIALYLPPKFNDQKQGMPNENNTKTVVNKVYIGVEGEGKIAVLDPVNQKIIKNIDLSLTHDGEKIMFSPHNVQTAPDGKSILVTVNYMDNTHDHGLRIIPQTYAHDASAEEIDHIVIIDPLVDQIIGRISIAPNAHLAHVVLTPDSKFAYVTAQKGGAVYKIDILNNSLVKKISLPENAEPHGLRISPDGSKVYVALMGGKAMEIVDVRDNSFSAIPLSGIAVQTGVTPDGKYVFASIYDRKSIAMYEPVTGKLSYIPLPEGAKGPVQIYPTPDGKYLFIADQGYYFGQPSSHIVYKLDIIKKKVIKAITTGDAPHGVVVSDNGKLVFVTNLLSNDVSIIDTSTDREVKRIPVGKEPNGITYWSKK